VEVFLLERMSKVGNAGEQVRVKSGFARNFLIPQGKALPATEANKKKIEANRANLEKAAQERHHLAQERADRLEGVSVSIAAQASAEGRLFGSIGAQDIARALAQAGHTVARSEIELLEGPIRATGEYEIQIQMQGSDLSARVKVTIIAA
jgi:large subunit ribosomal protein L9